MEHRVRKLAVGTVRSPEVIQISEEVTSDWLISTTPVYLFHCTFASSVFYFRKWNVDVKIIIETDILLHGPLGWKTLITRLKVQSSAVHVQFFIYLDFLTSFNHLFPVWYECLHWLNYCVLIYCLPFWALLQMQCSSPCHIFLYSVKKGFLSFITEGLWRLKKLEMCTLVTWISTISLTLYTRYTESIFWSSCLIVSVNS